MTTEEKTTLIDELIYEDKDVTVKDYLVVKEAENEIYQIPGIIRA